MDNQLLALQHIDPSFANIVKIEWHMGFRCNFTCSYCSETNPDDGFVDVEKFKKSVERISKHFSDKKLVILLTGGEPSIHPKIKEIVDVGKIDNIQLEMVTNGSCRPDIYTEILSDIFAFTFSVHFEQNYQKTVKTIDAVYDQILQYRKQGIEKYIQVNVMFTPGYLEEVTELVNHLEKCKIKYIVRRIRPWFDKDGFPVFPDKLKGERRGLHKSDKNGFATDFGYYSSEEMKFIKKHSFIAKENTQEIWQLEDSDVEVKNVNANDVLARKLNYFKGWKCWAGLERLQVMPNGDLYRSSCRVGGCLGNVYEEFSLPQDPVNCTRERCTCAWAVNLSKSRQGYEKLLRAKKQGEVNV